MNGGAPEPGHASGRGIGRGCGENGVGPGRGLSRSVRVGLGATEDGYLDGLMMGGFPFSRRGKRTDKYTSPLDFGMPT